MNIHNSIRDIYNCLVGTHNCTLELLHFQLYLPCYFLPVFDSIVSNRVNLYYTRRLDSNTVGYRFNAVQYIMLLHTVLQWQQQNTNQTLNSQKTPVSRASYGCLLWGSGEKWHRHRTITLHMNVFKAWLTEVQRRIGELYRHWLR